MTKPKPPFRIFDRLRYADDTLSKPPRWEWTRRVTGRGKLVQRFVLPLELCQTSNQRMRGGLKQRFVEASIKRTVEQLMLGQNNGRKERAPLSGRPQVLAIRFSSREADATSDWAKTPIDRLLVKGGLGYLVDDSPRFADVHTWCEYAPAGEGFCLIEVWTGEEAKSA